MRMREKVKLIRLSNVHEICRKKKEKKKKKDLLLHKCMVIHVAHMQNISGNSCSDWPLIRNFIFPYM